MEKNAFSNSLVHGEFSPYVAILFFLNTRSISEMNSSNDPSPLQDLDLVSIQSCTCYTFQYNQSSDTKILDPKMKGVINKLTLTSCS
jgi:hypothetical protein